MILQARCSDVQVPTADTVCPTETAPSLIMSPNEITSNTRIPNVTRHSWPRYSQAKRAVEIECTAKWVDCDNHSSGIVDISWHETLKQRAILAKLHSGLEPINPGDADIREVMPRSAVWTAAVRYEVLGRAREFYREAIAQ